MVARQSDKRTAVRAGRRRRIVGRCYDVSGHRQNVSQVLVQVTACITTHETYSLSFLVVRTSGSLPNRPMSVSLATSCARREDVENACQKWTPPKSAIQQLSAHACARHRTRLTRLEAAKAVERAAENMMGTADGGVVERSLPSAKELR